MSSDRYNRQSFLGANSEEIFADAKIGIIGLGGGGSHIVQQLAHIGIKNYVIYDPDVVEESNLNRLVGATAADVLASTPKVAIARRLIESLHDDAIIEDFRMNWQSHAGPLKSCDIMFGSVDTFLARHEIEVLSRRYLIPYIDIGMDVHSVKNVPPRMAGQVFLSMPGGPCMYCLNFLTESKLAEEASKYGAVGNRPQVIWPNGILASSAVGIAIDLLTDWTQSLRKTVYLSYDGNTGTLQPHVQIQHFSSTSCPHFSNDNIGDPSPKRI